MDYGNILIKSGTWYIITLIVLSDQSEAYIDGNLVGRCNLIASSTTGLAAIGSLWDFVQFDNFRLQSPS